MLPFISQEAEASGSNCGYKGPVPAHLKNAAHECTVHGLFLRICVSVQELRVATIGRVLHVHWQEATRSSKTKNMTPYHPH
jgi:hypothetical protein